MGSCTGKAICLCYCHFLVAPSQALIRCRPTLDQNGSLYQLLEAVIKIVLTTLFSSREGS